MVEKLLYLQRGELRRLLPFFGTYFLLFLALTLADGLSLALFVQRVGAANLPTYYGVIALANLLVIGAYILVADRSSGLKVFQLILGGGGVVYLVAWTAVQWLGGGDQWYGLLFAGREISYTLILMHFGTYLQDYFTRVEMNRVLPIIYAGGRVGGIAGGWALERLSAPLGLMNFVLVFVGLSLLAMLALAMISRWSRQVHAAEDERGDVDLTPVRGQDNSAMEQAALTSPVGFLRFAWASPLMFWTTVTSLLYIGCRWILNYQYNSYFEHHFTDDVAMAQFLGRYTQIALGLSLVLQLLVVNRLVAWIGLKGAHLVYGALLFGGMGLNVMHMTLGLAVFSRLLETELRFGLRNPIHQMLTNKFSKRLRIRVRAWNLGLLIPFGTLAVSGALSGLLRLQAGGWIAWLGGATGLAYLLCSFGLYGSFGEKPRPPDGAGEAASPPDKPAEAGHQAGGQGKGQASCR